MKTSTILIKAKKLLAKNNKEKIAGKVGFICWAVNDAVGVYSAAAVIDKIEVKLYPHHSLDRWIDTNHPEMYLDFIQKNGRTSDKYFDKMQATRHAWIDSMIAEFQAKGD